jgi:KEOPS complex subunit Pcc1
MKRALICIKGDKNMSRAITDSLAPEMDRKIPRTKVNITWKEDILLDIQAQDTNALRAALNSYLRWVKVTIDTREEILSGKRETR